MGIELLEIMDLIHLFQELLPLSVVVVEVLKEQFEMVQQVVLVVEAEVTLLSVVLVLPVKDMLVVVVQLQEMVVVEVQVVLVLMAHLDTVVLVFNILNFQQLQEHLLVGLLVVVEHQEIQELVVVLQEMADQVEEEPVHQQLVEVHR